MSIGGTDAPPPGLPLDPMTEEQIHGVTIGEPEILGGPVELADYDPEWPERSRAREDCGCARANAPSGSST